MRSGDDQVIGDRNATPSNWHGNLSRPVEKVSWDDAQVFLTRLNEQQAGNLPAGWSYVLPTESQWEYAVGQGRPPPIPGVLQLPAQMRIIVQRIFADPRWGLYAANPWGF